MHSSHNRPPLAWDETLLANFQDSLLQRQGLKLRDCQALAAKHLLGRAVAELATGEGKTIATALAACQHANNGRSVHIATANDYLAKRDALAMAALFNDLGITVGWVTSDSSLAERRAAYRAQVVYGTLKEFAFDYLKHSLGKRQADAAANDLAYTFDVLLVDEADSVLIDEARTPLIITAATETLTPATEACYRWSADFVRNFTSPADYVYLPDLDAIALTENGRRRLLLAQMPSSMGPLSTTEIQHAVERALWVNTKIHRDVHYLVDNNQIKLVDEYTGRQSAQRSFGGGIQQALQARESLPLTPQSQPAAKITVQDYVNKFEHLAGITATAWEDRHELAGVYDVVVNRVNPHVPCRRVDMPPVVSRSAAEKMARIATETLSQIHNSRCVLVATRTIEQSERLSDHFRQAGIRHSVLSARNPEAEASIVACAGQTDATGRLGRVTIATNMAGRGTDIRLDDQVRRAGGLHVIVSEPHAAARIDRQLYGRSGRQGDPGTAQLHCSPEDEILEQAFGPERAQRIRRSASGGVSDRWLVAQLSKAQRQVARRHRVERARLTAHEAAITESLKTLGLDPHLDPLPTNF